MGEIPGDGKWRTRRARRIRDQHGTDDAGLRSLSSELGYQVGLGGGQVRLALAVPDHPIRKGLPEVSQPLAGPDGAQAVLINEPAAADSTFPEKDPAHFGISLLTALIRHDVSPHSCR